MDERDKETHYEDQLNACSKRFCLKEPAPPEALTGGLLQPSTPLTSGTFGTGVHSSHGLFCSVLNVLSHFNVVGVGVG